MAKEEVLEPVVEEPTNTEGVEEELKWEEKKKIY